MTKRQKRAMKAAGLEAPPRHSILDALREAAEREMAARKDALFAKAMSVTGHGSAAAVAGIVRSEMGVGAGGMLAVPYARIPTPMDDGAALARALGDRPIMKMSAPPPPDAGDCANINPQTPPLPLLKAVADLLNAHQRTTTALKRLQERVRVLAVQLEDKAPSTAAKVIDLLRNLGD